jgi:glycosyltransferase involved in cell wall biosynthesis
LIGYEGLDTLIEAVARLKENEVAVRVHIVGDGEARSSLEALAERLGVEDCVLFMGRQAPDVAREAIRRCAVVCLPRKPYEVCRVVPPIKLVEALAIGKPVIVPDLPVFRDELGDDPAGWFFRAGDSADLARVIGVALGDPGVLRTLGARAREYVVSQRCWSNFIGNALPAMRGESLNGRQGH